MFFFHTAWSDIFDLGWAEASSIFFSHTLLSTQVALARRSSCTIELQFKVGDEIYAGSANI